MKNFARKLTRVVQLVVTSRAVLGVFSAMKADGQLRKIASFKYAQEFGLRYRKYSRLNCIENTAKESERGLIMFNRRTATQEPEESGLNIYPTFRSLQEFLERLQNMTTLNSQAMHSNISEIISMLLEAFLQDDLPGARVHPFGSRITGLAFPDSDVDMFVDIGHMYGGSTSQDHWTQCYIVEEVARYLRNCPEITNLVTIKSAKIPIVRFIHAKSHMSCDIMFRNGLGVQATKLMNFYLSLDPNIRPMIVFIKSWAKKYNMLSTLQFKSYALAWMAIFYLQRVHILNLPTIEDLREMYEGEHEYIAGWESSFCSDVSKVTEVKGFFTSSSVLSLVFGFLEYYSTLDLNSLVICPLVGRPVRIDSFNDLHDLPKAMKCYTDRVLTEGIRKFPIKPICVQDPFELNNNITCHVSAKMVKKFKWICGKSAMRIENML